MTERKWTKGPWVKPEDGNTVKGSIGNTVADVRYKNGHNDAHLIAAAPDLYEALEYLLENSDLTHGDKIVACEALSKARGETQ